MYVPIHTHTHVHTQLQVYNYHSGFPRELNTSMFGNLRSPAVLVKSAELVRRSTAAQSLIHLSLMNNNTNAANGNGSSECSVLCVSCAFVYCV